MDFFFAILPCLPARAGARVSIPDLRGHLRAETDTKRGLCGLLGREVGRLRPHRCARQSATGTASFSFPHSHRGPPSPAGSTAVSPIYQILDCVPPLRVTPLQRSPFPLWSSGCGYCWTTGESCTDKVSGHGTQTEVPAAGDLGCTRRCEWGSVRGTLGWGCVYGKFAVKAQQYMSLSIVFCLIRVSVILFPYSFLFSF